MYLRYVLGSTEEELLAGSGVGVPPHAARITIDGVWYRVVELDYRPVVVPSVMSNEKQIRTVVTVWLEKEALEDDETGPDSTG